MSNGSPHSRLFRRNGDGPFKQRKGERMEAERNAKIVAEKVAVKRVVPKILQSKLKLMKILRTLAFTG